MLNTTPRFLFASLIMALVAGLLYIPGLPGEFVFDDIPNIVNNDSIHLNELTPAAVVDVLATPQVSGSMRSLPTLSFALDYWRAGGADPAAFKTTNILIHAITAFALAWLFRSLLLLAKLPLRNVGSAATRLEPTYGDKPPAQDVGRLKRRRRGADNGAFGRNDTGVGSTAARLEPTYGGRNGGLGEPTVLGLALALALAWAAHPLLVSSVLYAVQRLQTMGTLFLVLAVLAYLHGRRAQIEGRPGRTGLLLSVLLWAFALGCKEDSALLPAYTLALELTVLRFRAGNAQLAAALRRGYLLATLAALLVYVAWVIPHYWNWEAYSGRDYNSAERLLTQARLLCLYLWQIVLPLPQHMPFYYDWVQPSRSLLQPWTTLPAIGVIATLLVLAWRLRHKKPLLALGIFLFFSAHFITSNVIGLELAFEHRNHFALIGAVLAIGSALAWVSQRLKPALMVQATICAILLASLCTATLIRAHDWRNSVSLAAAATRAAPASPRAWIDLCVGHLKEGGGIEAPDNPKLDDAIAACAAGADADSNSLNNLAVLLALKTRRGDISPQDWARFQQRLSLARMTWDNVRAPFVLAHYASLGVPMDKQQTFAAFAMLDRRVELSPPSLAQIGDAVVNTFHEPELAYPYFAKAIEKIPPDDPATWELAAQMRADGWPDLAQKIENLGMARYNAAMNAEK